MREQGVDNPEGIWLVEIRDWEKPTQWLTKEVTVERFPYGSLEIYEHDTEYQRMRHYRDVRKWVRKVRSLDDEPSGKGGADS